MTVRSDKRTTVSLAGIVWEMAEEMMDHKGYNNNFSQYVADLVRRDMERYEEVHLAKKEVERDESEAVANSSRPDAVSYGKAHKPSIASPLPLNDAPDLAAGPHQTASPSRSRSKKQRS